MELPAVIVAGVSRPLPKTGLSLASFAKEVSLRRFASRVSPRYGVMRSSKNPRSYAAASAWWLAAAISSCASRVIRQAAVVSAWCSPMDRPVRGSAVVGAAGARCAGRMVASAASFAGVDFARDRSSSARRSGSLTATGASDVESTPPAMPDSIWPSRILLASPTTVSIPVAHACWTS